MEALLRGEGGWVLFKLRWPLTTSYVDHGHVVKQFSENNEMSFVAHFKRSCGTILQLLIGCLLCGHYRARGTSSLFCLEDYLTCWFGENSPQ